MMGKITRQELADGLRYELDDVKNYIAGSQNEEMGAHMNNVNNPHGVTKAQVGLGNIRDTLSDELDAHALARNPHGTTASDVGAPPISRLINAGTGLTGSGTLASDRTISLDLSYTDGRYLKKNESAVNADTVGGFTHWDFLKVGQSYLPMSNNDGIRLDDTNNEFYFEIDGSNKRAYHSGNITYGTSNPSGGRNGDIYIQY